MLFHKRVVSTNKNVKPTIFNIGGNVGLCYDRCYNISNK